MVEESPDHLIPEIRNLLKLSQPERIEYIQRDNWIGYTRAIEASLKLHELYSYPQRQRMPNILIIGPTNNGKTMIIEKFCRVHKPIVKRQHIEVDIYDLGEQNLLEEMPVVSVQMPPSPDTRRFYLAILEKFKMQNVYIRYHTGPLEITIISLFKKFKVKMLLIDEIHNILAGRNDKQREFLNVLRFLGNELKIPLVCVGTKDAYLAIRSDPQLENRFEPFPLPLWKAGREYDSLLSSIVAVLPLKKPSKLNMPSISENILAKSEGILGEMFTLLRRAAISAIRTGKEEIDEMALRLADYYSPSERRQLFERNIA